MEELETDFNPGSIDSLNQTELVSQELTEKNFHLDDKLADWERRYINHALTLSNGNLSKAARILGVNRTTLYSRLQRLNITINPQ